MAVLPGAVRLHRSCWPLMHRPGYGSCTQQLHVFIELKATAEGQGGQHRSSNKDSTSDSHSQADRGGVAGAASASSSTHGQATSSLLLNAREMGMAVVREVGGSFSGSLLQRGSDRGDEDQCDFMRSELLGKLRNVINAVELDIWLSSHFHLLPPLLCFVLLAPPSSEDVDIYSVSVGRLLPPSPRKSKPEADILPFLINSPTPTSLAQKSKPEVGQRHLMFGQPLRGIWISQGSLKGGVACKYPSKAVPETTGDGNPHP
ncbi:hypothetical protein CPB84DRAFT_1746696 [Gymnopilus junonius]|uniref:Uncharacterized protein n=1 Tax=Gymnopilus junonius TaxID=109634 RepID=A0A9P5NSN7_GYMJU|nr:hypothetical protein CPB84DRAFT_1746696 [Gymnopilus junonius]